MIKGIIERSPLFKVADSARIDVSVKSAYDLVSELAQSRLWSPECRGGVWKGPASQVGSVFTGENFRADEVVGWAPLVRGKWFTEAEIIVADPGRSFQWAMRTHTGENQPSIWGFAMDPSDEGCILTHHFEMTVATEGIHKILRDLDEPSRVRFVQEWSAKLESDLRVTLMRIKTVLEKPDLASVATEGVSVQ